MMRNLLNKLGHAQGQIAHAIFHVLKASSLTCPLAEKETAKAAKGNEILFMVQIEKQRRCQSLGSV
jgi:hypothetical protein